MKCLVIMPFREEFDVVFETVRRSAQSAVEGEHLECFWLKDVQSAGRITDDIIDGIRESAACVADLTGSNPNVMWETGYAMALGKPTILIGQSVESIPFDLKVHRVLSYEANDLESFEPRLAEAVRQTLSRYEIPASPQPVALSKVLGTTIAVTGSMMADRHRVSHRLKVHLEPYLSPHVTWLCGSNGTTDECVVDFLVERGQRVVAVGYHRYDLSATLRDHVQAGRAAFLDASVAALPQGLEGPTQRDVLFAARADLVILFWSEGSRGVRRLVRYYRDCAKDTLLAFL